jgi:hypothetical protein
VRNRDYSCSGAYVTEDIAHEKAAEAAYYVCCNFSVNDGMFPRQRQTSRDISRLLVARTGRRILVHDKTDHSSVLFDAASSNRSSHYSISSSATMASAVSVLSIGSAISTPSSYTTHSAIPSRQRNRSSTPELADAPCSRNSGMDDTARNYVCVFCEESFTMHDDWQIHERQHHENQTQFECPDCDEIFFVGPFFTAHHRDTHGCSSCEHALQIAKGVDHYKKRTAWGCGFCAGSFEDWDSRCDHVAAHYNDGVIWEEWDHSNVITGLLRQPEIYSAWHSLLRERYEAHALPDDLKFRWNKATTGRSNVDPQLQDLLELGLRPDRNISDIVLLAYNLGRCAVAGKSVLVPAIPVSVIEVDEDMKDPNGLEHEEKTISEASSSVAESGDEMEDIESNTSDSSKQSTWVGVPNDAEKEVVLGLVMEPWKSALIDSLMIEFRSLLGQKSMFSARGANEGSTNSNPETGACQLNQTSSQTSKLGKKRQRESVGGGDDGRESDGEENEGPRKGPRTDPINLVKSCPKLACPYHQRNPQNHKKYRSCAGPGWDTAHRVK